MVTDVVFSISLELSHVRHSLRIERYIVGNVFYSTFINDFINVTFFTYLAF